MAGEPFSGSLRAEARLHLELAFLREATAGDVP
jgi:hypothetical protein